MKRVEAINYRKLLRLYKFARVAESKTDEKSRLRSVAHILGEGYATPLPLTSD